MRTRFAPSPTGSLHVGGLRTALYAWLLAHQNKGAFLLRIEDTDQERSVPGAIEEIVEALHWAGIPPDEGVMLVNGEITEQGSHGPYTQSKRLPLYHEYAAKLIASGHAYHCFCTPERLELMRKSQQSNNQAPMYDRTCLQLAKEEVEKRIKAGERHVLRLKIPRERTITFTDDIRGEVSFRGDTIDDQVLLKGDGFPTYHLAHVVDDHLMEIDIVIRGEEWLPSTPKHLILFEAFGWAPPRYAHVPLLLNRDRTKLSKREGAVSTKEFIDKGYLPEVMRNFLLLLGWNPGTEQEMFSLKEMLDQFSLERVQKAGAIFDLEKLDWLQGQWMRKIPLSDFADRIRDSVGALYPAALKDPSFQEKAALIQERITFFREAPDMLGYFYEEPSVSMDVVANAKQKVTPEIVPAIIALLTNTLEAISEKEWKLDAISDALLKGIEGSTFKKGQVLWTLRAILTGRDFSPGAFEVATVLGKSSVLKRLGNLDV